MTRDEVSTRSEGALEAAERALTRVENGLGTSEWFAYARAQTRMPRLLDEAIEQVARVDSGTGAGLRARYDRCRRLARRRLERLGSTSDATRLDDLLAQLVARARQLDELPPMQLPLRELVFGACALGALVAALATYNTPWPRELGFFAIGFVVAAFASLAGVRTHEIER
ncbi:MAG: hypothetical protein JNK82_45295 [Myxococcaceae bacterium]|nr:hypothetical protein [Myxococcaceae bacterium]